MAEKDRVHKATKMIDLFICPICETEYRNQEEADECFATGKAIKNIQEVYEAGCFLLINEKVIPVHKPEEEIVSSCRDSIIKIAFASSDTSWYTLDRAHAKPFLQKIIRRITITEAVSLGWRVESPGIWETRATSEMKKEYIEAIRKIIDSLSSNTKETFLIEHLGGIKIFKE